MKKKTGLVFNPDGKTEANKILDRIRKNRGKVFVDPCPSPKTLETLGKLIGKIFKS